MACRAAAIAERANAKTHSHSIPCSPWLTCVAPTLLAGVEIGLSRLFEEHPVRPDQSVGIRKCRDECTKAIVDYGDVTGNTRNRRGCRSAFQIGRASCRERV